MNNLFIEYFSERENKEITIRFTGKDTETIDFKKFGWVYQYIIRNNAPLPIAFNKDLTGSFLIPGNGMLLVPGHPYLRNTTNYSFIMNSVGPKDVTFILSIIEVIKRQ